MSLYIDGNLNVSCPIIFAMRTNFFFSYFKSLMQTLYLNLNVSIPIPQSNDTSAYLSFQAISLNSS
jgi:hypothetical protein